MKYASIPLNYIRTVLGPRDPILDEVLRTSLLNDRIPPIQVDDNAGRVLQLLTLLHKPKHVVEIGALFGYSTIHIARGLPSEGRLTAIEVSPDLAKIARRNILTAKLADKVELVADDAAHFITTLEDQSVDMVFIDADKKAYPEYLKLVYPKIRRGGIIIADDAFAEGDFTTLNGGAENNAELKGIHRYNTAIAKSRNLFSAFLGTETGLLVSIKL